MNSRPIVPLPIRRAVIQQLLNGNTYQSTADLFNIGVATVNRIWRRYRLVKKCNLKPRGGGTRPVISPSDKVRLRRLVEKNSDATFDELTSLWNTKTKVSVSRSAIVRAVKSLGFSLKKKSVQAAEKKSPKNKARRSRFLSAIKTVPREKCVFLDESGFQTTLRRPLARALVGRPATYFYPAHRGKNITICGAIRSSGRIVMEGKPRAMTRKAFVSFLNCRLFPRLKPKDTLVLDNLSSHKGAAVKACAKKWDIRLLYLPPYSPELNPIEWVWAWMKARVRGRVNRTKDHFRYAVAGAWRRITAQQIEKTITRCFPLQSSHAI